MLDQILDIKQRREDAAVKAEISARLELEQAARAVQAEQRRKSDYESWSATERERLFAELQEHGSVRYGELMQWNAQIADLKQGLLDIEARIMALEQARAEKLTAHREREEEKQDAQQQVVKFAELVSLEEDAARLAQQAYEERELEDFRRPAQ